MGIAWRASRWRAAFALALDLPQRSLWTRRSPSAIGRFIDGIVDGAAPRRCGADAVGWIVGLPRGRVSGIFAFPHPHGRPRTGDASARPRAHRPHRRCGGHRALSSAPSTPIGSRPCAVQRQTLAGAFDAVCMNIGVAVGLVASLGVLVRLARMDGRAAALRDPVRHLLHPHGRTERSGQRGHRAAPAHVPPALRDRRLAGGREGAARVRIGSCHRGRTRPTV